VAIELKRQCVLPRQCTKNVTLKFSEVGYTQHLTRSSTSRVI